MPCEIRGNAIICSRSSRRPRKCSVCHIYDGTQLCDGPKSNGKTCDVPLCRRCAHRVGEQDFCPDCRARK